MPTYVTDQQFAAPDEAALPIQSAGTQESPLLARLVSGGFVTAWRDGRGIVTRMFDADGREVGAEYVLPSSSSGYHPAIVGLPGGGYAVAFYTASNGVQVRTFDASGVASGPAFRANPGEFGGQQPSLAALPDGNLVVAWNAGGSPTLLEARIFQPSGIAVTDMFIIATGTSMSTTYPIVTALADGNFVATWGGGFTSNQQGTVYAQLYDANGRVVGPTQHIEAPPSGPYASNFFQSVAALANGGFVMSWTHDTFEIDSIQFQLFNADGTPNGPVRQLESALSAGQSTVAVLDNGGFVVAWQAATVDGGPNYFQQGDIHAQVFDASGAAVGAQFVANSVTASGQGLPVVAGFGTNDFAMVWQTFSPNGDSDVAVRKFYSTTLGTAGDDTFRGTTGRDFVIGAGGADILSGDGGNDTIDGGDGHDVLLGGTGADDLIGGTGDDAFEVDSLGDRVVEVAAEGTADKVYAYVDFTLPDNVESLVMLYGNQRFGLGNAGDNIIYGNGQGNALEGGAGYDTLTGGAGSDLFIVNSNFGVDVITDFVAGEGTQDAILFSRSLFTSFAQVMGNAAQVGADTWIGDGHGNTVVLSGVSIGSLHPDDFGFI